MDTLQQARIRAGKTIEEIARKADISRATINNAERGKTIKLLYAIKIVTALNEIAGTSYTVDELGIKTRP